MKSLTFGPGKTEIGLGTAIFGISASNYKGELMFRPNPRPGDPFRDRLKISVPNTEVLEGELSVQGRPKSASGLRFSESPRQTI